LVLISYNNPINLN